MVMGFDLSILSLIALLGLSGILVNDSIILVAAIDERRRQGQTLDEAITAGAAARLRAVIRTSATTIGGLTPLMFETSFQARFLIPLAITLVFGLMVTSFLGLFLVPAMVRVQGEIGRLIGGLRRRRGTDAVARA
jgi:multidrug efflux pump subunit AcrB